MAGRLSFAPLISAGSHLYGDDEAETSRCWTVRSPCRLSVQQLPRPPASGPCMAQLLTATPPPHLLGSVTGSQAYQYYEEQKVIGLLIRRSPQQRDIICDIRPACRFCIPSISAIGIPCAVGNWHSLCGGMQEAAEKGCDIEIKDGVVYGVNCQRLDSFEDFVRQMVWPCTPRQTLVPVADRVVVVRAHLIAPWSRHSSKKAG